MIPKPLRSSDFPNRAVYADQESHKEACWYSLQIPFPMSGTRELYLWFTQWCVGSWEGGITAIYPFHPLMHFLILLPSLKILQSLCSLLRKILQEKRHYILAHQHHKEQLLLSSVLLSFKVYFLYPLEFWSCVHTIYSWITNVLRQETVLSTTL